MPKVLSDLVLWACQIAALYAWKILGIEGAGNLLTAWVIVLLVVTVLMVFVVDLTKPYVKPKGLPRWIGWPLALGFFGVLVWFGHAGLAAAYGVAVAITIVIHAAWADEHRKRQEQAA